MYISHASTLGGAEQSLIDIIKYLKEQIHPIVILPKNGAIEQILDSLYVKYYIYDYPQTKENIGKKDSNKNAKDFCKTYEIAHALMQLIKEEQIDLIHTNTTVVDVGALAAIMAGIPHIWHFRELMEEDFNIEYQDIKFKKFLFKNTSTCISISQCVYEKYKNTYHIKSKKINDGIDTERFLLELGNKDLDNHNFYVAGSISRNKGQIDAIKAIGLLAKEGYENVTLYIVGSASRQDKWCLHKYIKKHKLERYIKFSDFVYSLGELRKNCIGSITTSKMEALGRVTVEAMLAGNIVIGANTGGTAEILDHDNEYGYLYEQGNSEDLARKIKAVLALPMDEKRKRIKKAQQYAKEKFDPIVYSNQLVEVYEKAIIEYTLLSKQNQDVKLMKKEMGRITQSYEATKKELQKEQNQEEVTKDKTSFINCIFEKMQSKNYIKNLEKNHISHVAVYGVGKIGMELIDMLEKTDIQVDYVIDQTENFLSYAYDYYKPYDQLPKTEAIIITIKNASHISTRYKKAYHYKILHMEEIV